MTYHVYQACYECSRQAQPGTVALMKYTLTRFPYCRSLGIYACREVRGGGSLSIHACGRALDVGIPTLSNGQANTALGDPVVQFFDQYSDALGIFGQIYNRVRYDARSPRGRYYTGTHPHYNHDHVEQRMEYATSLTYADIVAIAGTPEGRNDDMWLHGLDIGKTGQPVVTEPRVGTLQAFLIGEGYDLGATGVDGRAGDITRRALNQWKVHKAGITADTSAGEGKIGDWEAAGLLRAGGSQEAIDIGPALEPYATKQYVADTIDTHAGNPDAHHA